MKKLTVTNSVLIDGKVIPFDQAPPEVQREVANRCKVAIAEMQTGQKYTIERTS